MKFGKILGIAAVVAGTAPAFAVIHTLEDRNSRATVNDASSSGMTSWTVDGTNQLFQQWFWYRLAGDTQESAINSLPLMGSQATDTNVFVDPRVDTVSLLYGTTVFEAEITFQLRGGAAGSGQATIAEQIRLTNRGSTPLSLSFFQYSDFDVNGTAGGDTVEITGGNTAWQSDGAFGMSETVVTPMPSHYQAGAWPSILNGLNDGAITNLNDTAGPLTGDMSWAFQWDFDLGAGDSVVISKVKGITPAPGALALLGLGGVIAGRRRR